jgi:hypothetical protein
VDELRNRRAAKASTTDAVPLDEKDIGTARTFSLANPKGPEQHDVPALLERLAQHVKTLGRVEVHDITYGVEINEYGMWPSFTVYFDSSHKDD